MSKARDIARAGTALSSVDATELGYLDGVTSNVQTQMDAKLATATAASTYQPLVSGVSDTEIGYLDGVTSAIQTQLDAKAVYPTQTGNSGKYLTTDGSTASWGTVSSGAVLQVKSARSATEISTTSTTYVATGISVTITPSSASNKIALNLTGGGLRLYPNGQSCGMKITIYRNGTNIASGLSSGSAISNYYTEGSVDTYYAHSTGFVDAPSSTSALTYEVYFLATNTNRAAYINAFTPTAGVVTLTAMEVTP